MLFVAWNGAQVLVVVVSPSAVSQAACHYQTAQLRSGKVGEVVQVSVNNDRCDIDAANESKSYHVICYVSSEWLVKAALSIR